MSIREKLLSNIRLIFIGVVILSLGFFVFWVVSLAQPEEAKGETQNDTRVLGPILETETFTVNLADSTKRYVRVQFALEVTNNKTKTELENKKPLIQDTIIMVLSKQNSLNLNTVEGKENLKGEIISGINSFLEKGQIKNIYLKSFIIN